MAGAEAVKEVLNGHMPFNCGKVGNRSKVHAFLHARGSDLCPASLAAGHHVHMVAEDGYVAGSYTAGSNMHNSRKLKPCNAVHRWDHEHQTLC